VVPQLARELCQLGRWGVVVLDDDPAAAGLDLDPAHRSPSRAPSNSEGV
jgi:hypothetical protein